MKITEASHFFTEFQTKIPALVSRISRYFLIFEPSQSIKCSLPLLRSFLGSFRMQHHPFSPIIFNRCCLNQSHKSWWGNIRHTSHIYLFSIGYEYSTCKKNGYSFRTTEAWCSHTAKMLLVCVCLSYLFLFFLLCFQLFSWRNTHKRAPQTV